MVRIKRNKSLPAPTESKILKMAGKYSKYAKGKKINIDKIRDYIDYSDL